MSDALDRLRDVVGVQDEHSHVDAARRLRIGALILEVEKEELDATAHRLVADLPADDLAAIVTDWLDAQIAISLSLKGSCRAPNLGAPD